MAVNDGKRRAASVNGIFQLRERERMSWRRVILPKPGPSTSFQLQHITTPFPHLDNQHIRVRIAACAIAYRDLIDRKGGFPFMNQPTVLGHEIAGIVESVGLDSTLQPGDHVVSLHWAQYNGKGFPSPFHDKNAMKTFLGLTTDGGYADYITTHETAFVKVPSYQSWSAIDAAPVMSTFGTVWQGAMIRGQLKSNERVLVTGASGGVGSAAVVLASKFGCEVVGTTSSLRKKSYITSLGAKEVVDSTIPFSKLPSLRESCDMVIECVGAPTMPEAMRCLKPGGRLILIGNVNNSSVSLPLGMCIVKSLSVIGTDSIEAHELVKLFDWLTLQNVRPTIQEVITLDEESLNRAHESLENKAVNGRIVIDINSQIWR
jgi:acryloyl-coenzyme A reductase